METPQNKPESRPPVVVVMGHVDHGKTTLLDRIRKTTVAEKESGAITQHIGAYQTEHAGKKITFLDTPGHEAFSAIRSRGAAVADVAVLVVAADEGVKPQTLEALELIKKAALPFVVAMSKMDKPGAQAEKVKGELAEHEILVEGWGGSIPVVPLSAATGEGLETLLEMIELLAEVHRSPKAESALPGTSSGTVLESALDPRRGALATLLPREGTLRRGVNLTAGETFGRVRLMEDWEGRSVAEAPPSFPVRVIGFKEPPAAGDTFQEFQSLKEAESSAVREANRRKTYEPKIITLVSGKREHILNLVIRADVRGSIEAIVEALRILPVERVGIEILKTAVGPVSDSDLKIAEPKGATVIAFRVGVEPQASAFALKRGAAIMTFDVIYELIEFVRKKMAETLPRQILREDLGTLTILALFKKTPQGQIAGGKVTKGKIRRGASAELARNGTLLGRGVIAQLQQERVDVQETAEGRECGILFAGGKDLAVGDVLNVFEETEKAQEL